MGDEMRTVRTPSIFSGPDLDTLIERARLVEAELDALLTPEARALLAAAEAEAERRVIYGDNAA